MCILLRSSTIVVTISFTVFTIVKDRYINYCSTIGKKVFFAFVSVLILSYDGKMETVCQK